ncbi:MAG: hypothetical protein KDA91_05640 [Planctomycetaceae bacterium]|nr:hypothetical protein [Planctomycetaceae bacterium]
MCILDATLKLFQQPSYGIAFIAKTNKQSGININCLTRLTPPLDGNTTDDGERNSEGLQMLAQVHGNLQNVIQTCSVVR